jgi:electron transport complex protein RnfG
MKNMFKSDFAKMVTALTAVGVISGITLVFVYNYTMPKIKVNVSKATQTAIRNIFPDLAGIEEVREKDVFGIKDKDGKLMGYAFIAEGNGYQGIIKLIAGTDPELTKMHGMEVLESQETPGLGAEIASIDFRRQFQGLSLEKPIEYVKNRKPQEDYQIEAITGATISSRAVVRILNKKIEEMREYLKK